MHTAEQLYTACLEVLGYKLLERYNDDGQRVIAYGKERPMFWLVEKLKEELPTSRLHIAFVAESADNVHHFHTQALQNGGIDNGLPGYRPEYDEGYYAAFILDQDGNNIEALWRQPV